MPSNTSDPGRFQYKAFLSYSHAADGRLAEVIQSRLQRFATPWYRRRSIRVFRDTTGLGLTPDLWDAIRVALDGSEYFILFASEQAARSQWVGQEVDAFLSIRSGDHVLIVWTDGDLSWDHASADFDWTRTTCLPERLRGAFRGEPLHLDLRWARAAKDLSPRRPEFLDAVARISATLRQLPIDDLVGEDVKQHRRTRRVATAAAVAMTMLLVGSVVGAIIAIQQRNRARDQQRVAEEQREQSRQRLVRLMVENGVRLLDERDLSGSALWFAEAVRLEAGLPGQDLQRLRLRAALMQHPRLVQMWSTEREIGSRTLGRWVTFGRTDRYAVTNAVEGDLVPREGGFGKFEIAPALEPRLWDTATGRRVPLRLPAEGQRLLAIDAAADRLVIATAGEGGVRTWDGASGAPLAELPHPCAVRGADFSGDGRAILTDCDDGILRLWDPAGPTLLASLPHSAAVTFEWMTSDRRRVLVGTADNTAHMWTIGPQGRVSHVEIPHDDELQEVHVGLDGRRVFTLASYQARLWEIDNAGKPTLLKTTIDVNHIDVSPDGRSALLATGYGEALMWGLETANESFTVAHDDVVFDAAFSPDGRRFATASRDRTARVWDANSGAPLAAPLHHEGAVSRVDFSAQHARLATITQNETVRVWGIEEVPAHEHESIGRAAFLADGTHLMTVSSFEVKSWDTKSWKSVSIVPGHQVYDASASPDGGRIATATEDGVVRIWNAATGAELQSLRHGRRARQAVFSPDGRRLASAGQIEGRHEVAIWDLATGAKSFTLPHGNDYIDHIDFAPGGARLLTIASRTLRVWDLERRQEIAALSIADAGEATFDTAGARLAIAERATGVLVVEVPSGKRICPRIQLDNFGVSALAFTPDGRTLAVATEGGLVRLWSTETCQPTTPPFGHGRTTFVRHVAMSGDGRLLATAGNDGSARVWEVATARPVTPPLPHPDGVVHVTFSPDSRRLVTAGGDSVREWILSSDATHGTDAQMLAEAQVLAARRLDTTGAVSGMSLDEMRAAWTAFRSF